MRLLVQRVREASVWVANAPVATIGGGLLVLVGFGSGDHRLQPQDRIWCGMLDKLLHMRVFPDGGDEEKMARHVGEFGGSVLLVPQFTLYADCRKGRRPGFQDALSPAQAKSLFALWTEAVDAALPSRVFSGIFGASMDVRLCNWGPVTIMLDSDVLFSRPEDEHAG